MDIRIVRIRLITKKLWPLEVSWFSGLAEYTGRTRKDGSTDQEGRECSPKYSGRTPVRLEPYFRVLDPI